MIDETTKGSAARKASHCCSKSGNRTSPTSAGTGGPHFARNPASVFLTLGYARASTVESNGSTEKGRYSGSETPQPIRKCPPDSSLVHPSLPDRLRSPRRPLGRGDTSLPLVLGGLVFASRIVDKKSSLDFLHLGNPKTFVQPLRSPVKLLGDAISELLYSYSY